MGNGECYLLREAFFFLRWELFQHCHKDDKNGQVARDAGERREGGEGNKLGGEGPPAVPPQGGKSTKKHRNRWARCRQPGRRGREKPRCSHTRSRLFFK